MTWKAMIIDDEQYAREIVREYLGCFPDIQVTGEYEDGFSGLKAIQEADPDIVFLDIQMPRLNGFEMLEVMDKKPLIIFITAFDQYAIRAFEENAVDYLLKPFPEDRFADAVGKAVERLKSGLKTGNTSKLEKHLENKPEILNRVVVKNRTGIHVIPVDQILCLEAQDDYVMIWLRDGKFLKQKTMQYFEDHLDSSKFLRVHRSYIVRIDQIRKIEPYEKSAGIILLSDGKKVPVSRSGLSRLKDVLDF